MRVRLEVAHPWPIESRPSPALQVAQVLLRIRGEERWLDLLPRDAQSTREWVAMHPETRRIKIRGRQ